MSFFGRGYFDHQFCSLWGGLGFCLFGFLLRWLIERDDYQVLHSFQPDVNQSMNLWRHKLNTMFCFPLLVFYARRGLFFMGFFSQWSCCYCNGRPWNLCDCKENVLLMSSCCLFDQILKPPCGIEGCEGLSKWMKLTTERLALVFYIQHVDLMRYLKFQDVSKIK